MTKALLKSSKFVATIIACVFLVGCPCEDYVKMVVLVGHRSAEECRKALDSGVSDTVTIVCPGEEVTVCWASNTKGSINIEPKLGSFSNFGLTYFKPATSTTVTASAPGSCASSVSVPVTVVDHDTPSSWDGGWDLKCQGISFAIDPQFVSTKVFAKDILTTWTPAISDERGNIVGACATPPFLDGFQQEDVFGFRIDQPNITVPFSRHIPAVGHWKFAFKAQCPPGTFCRTNVPIPFDLTLTCAP